MNIAKALKRKNQLVGELAKLNAVVTNNNTQLNENVSRFNVETAYADYVSKERELIDLKTKIAKANADIWGKIFEIVELKGRISFLRSIPVREGSFRERDGYTPTIVENTYKVVFNAKLIQELISSLEAQISTLQDEIDDYNHTKDIG